MKKNAVISYGIIVILLVLVVSKYWQSSSIHRTEAISKHTAVVQTAQRVSPKHQQHGDAVPAYVLDVLSYVEQYQQAPKGYIGGRIFYNREKLLPLFTTDHIKIIYHEWDVHPRQPYHNRGAERLVTGSNHSAWYTANHYQSFIQIH